MPVDMDIFQKTINRILGKIRLVLENLLKRYAIKDF